MNKFVKNCEGALQGSDVALILDRNCSENVKSRVPWQIWPSLVFVIDSLDDKIQQSNTTQLTILPCSFRKKSYLSQLIEAPENRAPYIKFSHNFLDLDLANV